MKRQLGAAGALSPKSALKPFESLWVQFPWLTGTLCGIVAAGAQKTLHYPLQMPGRRDALFIAFALIAYRINKGKPVGLICGIAASLFAITTLPVWPSDPVTLLSWPLLGVMLDWMINAIGRRRALTVGKLMIFGAVASVVSSLVHAPWYWVHHGTALMPWFIFSYAAFGVVGVVCGQILWAIVSAKEMAATE